ncbi:fibronectin type III domain-containing protein [Persicobacter diffluens]|uniref:Fibronectin type-III domain-containing protein n=1 Tax=Persicobacter diffluens TaxID=981 RepID=A0AAN5ALV2_9BACT|nr:hypothetical protein PEDI_49270 [Persicobacter diffluens]
MKKKILSRFLVVASLLTMVIGACTTAQAQINIGAETNISALQYTEMRPGQMKGNEGWPPPMNDREWVEKTENGISFLEIPSNNEIADLSKALSPSVTYDLVFEEPGTYYYHMLFNCSEGNGSDDSCFPIWDWDGESTPTHNWNLGQSKTEWTWKMRSASITTTEANEAHRLTIFAREDGLQISLFAFRNKNWGFSEDFIPTKAPQNLTSAETENGFELSWDLAEIMDQIDQPEDITYHVVVNGEEVHAATEITSYEFTDVSEGQNYEAHVFTTDLKDNPSENSATVIALDGEAPTSPTNLMVTASTESTLTVTWEAATDNVAVTGYGVMIGEEEAIELDENTLTYTFENLEEYTQFTVKVYAMDAAGNTSTESEGQGMTLDVTAPEFTPNLTSSEIGETGLKVSWDEATDAGSGVAGYEIQLDDEEPMDFGAKVTDYTFTELNPYTTYSVRILAKDEAGNKTDFSEALEVMTIDETNPSPVTDLAVADVSGTQFSVSWTAATDNDQVAHYEYKLMQGDEMMVEATTTELLLVLDNLQGMTTYDFSVWAVDRAGNTSEVSTIQATTLDDEAPSVPTAIVVSEITETGFKLDWAASIDNVAVTVYRVKINEEEPIEVATYMAMVDGRMPLTEYFVSVAAGDASGNWSAYSDQISVSTFDLTPPSSPTALVVSEVTPFSAQLDWEASTDNVAVAHYQVYVNDEKAGETEELTFALDGLHQETSYSVSVKALDASGNASEAATATFETTRPLSNEVGQDKIKVFPNPAFGEMNIQLKTTEPSKFVIRNMAGQKVSEGIIKNGALKIHLPTGMYVLNINTHGQMNSQVIIFQ